MSVDPELVRERLATIRSEVGEAARRAGRDAADIELLAAIKYVTTDDLPALHAAGITLVGENRTDALIANQAAHRDLFRWHFIGHLQSRKARDLVDRVELVHALESLSSARQIDQRASAPQAVLVEVNTARDPSKYGVLPEDLDAFLDELAGLERIRVRGLMTMPAFAADPEESRPAFAALRELAAAASARHAGTHSFEVLSMGTSQDYLVAAEEGATLLRLGSVLYGRPAL